MTKFYKAYAPASSANLSVGFDLLGIALSPINGSPLGDFVTASVLESGASANAIPHQLDLQVSGRYVHVLPQNPCDNIIYDAYVQYKERLKAQNRDGDLLPLRLELEKNLPVCSGLGSSACSVVAAVLAIDAAHQEKGLGEAGVMELMGALEGKISGSIHYDNIAPCYLGGMQLIVNEGETISVNVPYFKDWYYVMCFPGIKVSTAAARSILPAQYLRQDVITFGRRLATFIHASHQGDEKMALRCLVDVMAEPYRASLIPGFAEARIFGTALGAHATGISGSGSTIFSIFTDLDCAEKMKEYLEREFIANEDGFCQICKVGSGASVEVFER